MEITMTQETTHPGAMRDIPLSAITEGERLRPVDRDAVDRLSADIAKQGLLSPIGLRARPDDAAAFDLIFGAHRLAATRKIEGAATIAALVWPAGTPDWQIEMAGISENLMRKELAPTERAAQTVAYIGLVKKHGLVTSVSDVRASAGSVGGSASGKTSKIKRLDFACSTDDNPMKPTASGKVTNDLGVSPQTLHARTATAVSAAERSGVVVPQDQRTPEKMSPEVAEAVAAGAMKTAEVERKEQVARKAEAKGKPKSARKQKPAAASPPAPAQPGDGIADDELLRVTLIPQRLSKQELLEAVVALRKRLVSEVSRLVAAGLERRSEADCIAFAEANEMLLQQKGFRSRPFTANEYNKIILWAVHPDNNDPDKATEAFYLLRKKKQLLCSDGPIVRKFSLKGTTGTLAEMREQVRQRHSERSKGAAQKRAETKECANAN
jgi:ParB-like nuclease domain